MKFTISGVSLLRISMAMLLSLVFVFDGSSQEQITVPYTCGFEDATEISRWTFLNRSDDGKECLDQWMVGNLDFYEGHKSLYISCDTGKNIQFGAAPDMVVAYRTYVFEADGQYDISFNYKGRGLEGLSKLHVCQISDVTDIVPNRPGDGNLPMWAKRNVIMSLSGATTWLTASFKLGIKAGRRFTLAFIWTNLNQDKELPNAQSVMIDNIQITSTNCLKPEKLEATSTCDTIMASWKGASEVYESQYRKRGAKIWQRAEVTRDMTSLRSTSLITNIEEGAYDFRVRGICNKDTSAWVYVNSLLVYCPDNHCINYVSLEKAVSEKGSANVPHGFKEVAPIDFGCDDKFSRHTVYWTQDQYDPRTQNRLRTIPDGEFAAVRLGNWETGAEAERVSYTYVVDSATSAVLLLKYAIVLEDPGHKPTTDQPIFKLEILDKNGDLIDPTCGEVYFEADIKLPGWYAVGNDLVWKDWTTMGLNLGEYDGDTLTVRLSTFDCKLGGHYGYAYFVLDCTSGHIKGNSCGDMPEITLEAPFGFTYDWYNPDRPDFSAKEQVITVPSNDQTTYYCTVGSLENPDCTFELSTKILPRYPKADFDYRIEHKDCQTKIYFENKSLVMSRWEGRDTVLQNDRCETFLWEIGNDGFQSPQENVVYAMPNEGGKLLVRLTSGISDNRCTDTYEFEIDVPSIYCHTDTLRESMCFGDVRIFGENFIMKSGVYTDSAKNVWGCDSVTVLEMNVWPKQNDTVVISDTICFGEVYEFNDTVYTKTGIFDIVKLNERGCDSVIVLDLTVAPEVKFTYSKQDVVDIPKSGYITIEPDVSLGNDWTYTVNGVLAGPLTGLDGGDYEIVVYNEYGCHGDTVTVSLYSECIDIQFDSVGGVCSGDRFVLLPYTLNAGVLSQYSVSYDSLALKYAGIETVDSAMVSADENYIKIELPDSCRPGNYVAEVVLHDVLCDDQTFKIPFSVFYDSTIVRQKWNDVLAVVNKFYNGGYLFSNFQWYRNGSVIPGANGAYHYLNGSEFNIGDSYCVKLKRIDDGVEVMSCPIMPVYREQVSDYVKVVSSVAAAPRVVVNIPCTEATVNVYTSIGQLVASDSYTGGEMTVDMPTQPGMFIVYVYNDEFGYVEKIRLY